MPDPIKETPGGESLPAPAKTSARNAAAAAGATYTPPLSADEVDDLISRLEPKALAEAGAYSLPQPQLRAYQRLTGALRDVRAHLPKK